MEEAAAEEDEPTATIEEGVVSAPETGNAGLLTGSAGSPWAALSLVALALVAVGGARTVTGRSRR